MEKRGTQGRLPGGTAPVGDALRATSKKDLRPTPDEFYLANRLSGDILWTANGSEETKASITPAALQRWNTLYGVEAVTAALRTAWGFPPLEGIENPYAYVDAILRGNG